MAEALRLVKADLGRDAIILHTRTVRKGGWFGVGAEEVVEVTASNDTSVLPRRRSTTAAPRPARTHAVARAYGLAPRAEAPAESTESPSSRPKALQPQLVAAPPPPSVTPSPVAAPAELNEEVRQIRRMVDRMMRRQADQPRPDLPDKLFDRYLALLEQEVSEELAEEVVQSVRAALGDGQHDDEAAVARAMQNEIARLIPVDPTPHRALDATEGRPLTIALIGPTGVGKTTTLAKLAATFKLRDGKRVALVTSDTYRIAAVDQLRTYADIVGLPLEVALTPQEMRAALERLSGYDVVLIDTAGRGQRDDEKLEELRAFVEAADPHEVHLVLSSTCGQRVLMEAVERFGRIRHDRIIFTKLDEAVSFGVLLNVVRRVNKRLSYVPTGQEVPHQIEPGRSEHLAGLIMGGGI